MIFASGSGGRQQPVGKPFQKPFQLYDVEKDPIEAENLIEKWISRCVIPHRTHCELCLFNPFSY